MQRPLRITAALMLAASNIAVAIFLYQVSDLGKGSVAAAVPAAEAGHGAHAGRVPASFEHSDEPVVPILLTFDDVVANIGPYDSPKAHMLIVKLNLELFEETNRKLIERRQGGVKHTILELARQQSVGDLKTLSGKVYFKEQIVAELNAYLNQPVVKDVHFASFLLR